MAKSVREHFEDRARELADCASLAVESDGFAETLRIVPHDNRALGVLLYRSLGGHDFEIRFDQPCSIPLEEPTQASDVDYLLDRAIDGRIRMYFLSSSSAVIEVLSDGEYQRDGLYGISSLMRMPGWRRRATLITFSPYRAMRSP